MNHNNNTITLDVSNLEWHFEQHGDLDDDGYIEGCHACQTWCELHDILVEFIFETREFDWDKGPYDTIEEAVLTTAYFQKEEDAALFRLRWSN